MQSGRIRNILAAISLVFAVISTVISLMVMIDPCPDSIHCTEVHYFFLAIKAEEINAVKGIASTMPILAETPLIVSSATNAVENRW